MLKKSNRNQRHKNDIKLQSNQESPLYQKIGTRQILYVVKKTQHGLYLGLESFETVNSVDESLSFASVLLPNVYVNGDEQIGDKKKVFLYTDSEDRLVATTQKPFAMRDEIALLRVKDKSEYGLFLDIGLAKDIFMPTKFPEKYAIDSQVVVRIACDKKGRLIAKKDITPLLKPCKTQALLHNRVRIFTLSSSELGFLCVVFPYAYQGMIYHNTLQTSLTLNTEYFAKVVKVRKDGKLDLILERNKEGLLAMIKDLSKENKYFTITSSCLEALGMSKKGMKKELSELITQKKIIFEKDMGYRAVF